MKVQKMPNGVPVFTPQTAEDRVECKKMSTHAGSKYIHQANAGTSQKKESNRVTGILHPNNRAVTSGRSNFLQRVERMIKNVVSVFPDGSNRSRLSSHTPPMFKTIVHTKIPS